MECAHVSFSRHAFERMFARGIGPDQVRQVIREGEAVESYQDDRPYPSFLLVGRSGEVWLHVVVAYDATDAHCMVATAYLPDPRPWDEAFRSRREP